MSTDAPVLSLPPAGRFAAELGGKVAIVTGASRGIGAAVARALAAEGAAVILVGRSHGALDDIAQAINAAGGRAIARAADVADYAALTGVVADGLATFGPIDILINNAGLIDPIARMAESDPAAWGHVVDVNVKGVYHGMRAVLPDMAARGTGVIVNISSGAATSALEGWSHYCATKAAVLMLTQCGHKEYGARGVRVVGLSPGTVATEMQVQIKASGINPVSQLDPSAHISPEAAAAGVVWLCTAEAATEAGGDFSLKTDDGRRRVGLIA